MQKYKAMIRGALVDGEIRQTTLENEEETVYLASEADARIVALEKALLRYGYHEQSCDFMQNEQPCTCGFKKLLQTISL